MEFLPVANTPQAKKRARQAEVHRQGNASHRSKMRTFMKKVMHAIEEKDKNAALVAFKEAVPIIDRMVSKKIIHINKAARHKSRLAQKIKALVG